MARLAKWPGLGAPMNLLSLYRNNQRIRARAVAREFALALLGAALAFGGFVVLGVVL